MDTKRAVGLRVSDGMERTVEEKAKRDENVGTLCTLCSET